LKLQPKALLFDSGQTLNYPRTGHWYIPPNFVTFFRDDLERSTSKARIQAAFAQAKTYWDTHQKVDTEQQEYEHFKAYYTAFFRSLEYAQISDRMLSELARDAVFNDQKYVFFDEVHAKLPQLAQHYRLGIVSDAWPSLERVFINQQLRDNFSSFVISSQVGVCKPDARMYKRALDDLQLCPGEVIFVDDNPRNLEGAYALGIQPVLIDRGRRIPAGFLKLYGMISRLRHSGRAPKLDLKTIWRNPGPFPRIGSLDDLENILGDTHP